MLRFAIAVALCIASRPALADKVVPTGSVKAYRGPEGEIVAMLLISDGKEMLVHFRHLDTELDGKTLRYAIADTGQGDKEVYIVKKRGSKTYRSIMLLSSDRQWTFIHPSKHDVKFALRYSEEWSDKLKTEDILKPLAP
jgi:hypothetical protein